MIYEIIDEIFAAVILFLVMKSIKPQFCVCHDSLAVVTYAKLGPDLMIIFQVRATQILHNELTSPL